MNKYNTILSVPIDLLNNTTLARIYWELEYTDFPKGGELRNRVEDAQAQCVAKIRETYDDFDVRYDFLESVRREVVN